MGEDSTTSILVVDDHEVVRIGIHAALTQRGFHQVTLAHSYTSAMKELSHNTFTAVIVDKNLGDGDGIDLAIHIKYQSPSTVIALLTVETHWSLTEVARTARINAVIDKTLPVFDLLEILRQLLLNPSLFISTNKSHRPKQLELLTPAEQEVLLALESGATTREIAARRLNSEATIKSHITSIYRKLGVRNRVEAIRRARGEESDR